VPLPPVPGARAVVDAVGSLRRVALENARASSLSITASRLQRRALQPRQDGEPGAAEDGTLWELDRGTCLELVAARSVGRLAYVARAGVPDVVPVNYAVHGDELLVRSGPGPKLQAAERREAVAVEVDDLDEASRTGWSVVVVGKARRLHVSEAQALPEDVLPVPWADGPRSAVLAVRMSRVTGRRLS
jgi:uncharacterized protein